MHAARHACVCAARCPHRVLGTVPAPANSGSPATILSSLGACWPAPLAQNVLFQKNQLTGPLPPLSKTIVNVNLASNQVSPSLSSVP